MGASPSGPKPRAAPRFAGPKPRAAPRFAGPFGGIEQRELDALPTGATAVHIAVLLVLRVRAGTDGWTDDRIETLATRAHVSPATMTRALAWLSARRLIEIQRMPAKGGPRGLVWWWRRRAKPYTEWPPYEDSTERSSSTEMTTAQSAAHPTMSTSETPSEPIKSAGWSRQSTRHNPEPRPESLPENGLSTERPAAVAAAPRSELHSDELREANRHARAGDFRTAGDLAAKYLEDQQRTAGDS